MSRRHRNRQGQRFFVIIDDQLNQAAIARDHEDAYSYLNGLPEFGEHVHQIIEVVVGECADDVTEEFADEWWEENRKDFDPDTDELPAFVKYWANPDLDEMRREADDWQAENAYWAKVAVNGGYGL